MAGRDKKSKSLSSTNASRESPGAAKQTTLLSFVSSTPSKPDGTDSMTPTASGAESPRRHGAALKPAPAGRAIKKKLKPNTKINIVRGRQKTKANFKLNIIKTQARQNMIEKTAARRGRPPNAARRREEEKPEDKDEGPPAEAKTRGRKRVTTDGEETDKSIGDATRASIAKESDNKKTVVKNVPKKVMKRKQLIVAKKALTKKKLLLAKQTLKTDTKQLNPKVLKKTLTAKLKSATEKLEAKKDATELQSQPSVKNSEASEEVLGTFIKKEPESLDSTINSRSSSPRGVTRRLRANSDIVLAKNLLGDSSPSPSGVKSPYSTRSDRSKSPFLQNEPAQKLLRNGKQRKLKNALLTETVEQEFKKRRRLLSDSKDSKSGELGTEGFDDNKKPKRLRSYSRDGSEISKCSDITESDLSFCDNMSSDVVESKGDAKEFSIGEDTKTDGSKDTSPAKSVSKMETDLLSEPVATISEESAHLPISNCMDNENNNMDDKNKTDALFVSEKLATAEMVESINNSLKQSEKLSEKSLILDKMSQTFNESLSDKSKSIRRSARQRKSTVKAKEQEEFNLIEKDGDCDDSKSDIQKGGKIDSGASSPKILSEANSDTDKKTNLDMSDSPKDTNSTKITAKKFYGDPSQHEANSKKSVLSEKSLLKLDKSVCSDPVKPDAGLPDVTIEPIGPKQGEGLKQSTKSPKVQSTEVDHLTVHEDYGSEEPGNGDILKENTQATYTNKSVTHHDIDKLIDKLRNFEELDKKRQEEKSNNSEKPSVMVTNDVVLMSKSNAELKPLKDVPIEKSKEKENILSCFENNSAISIIKKDQARKSFEIDLPNSVTLIKRTGSTSRKHSTSSNSRDGDSVTMIDKALGKDVTLELRKSIEKLTSPVDIIPNVTKTAILATSHNQALSISLKSHVATTVPKDMAVLSSIKDISTAIVLKDVPIKIIPSIDATAATIVTIPKTLTVTKEVVSKETVAPITLTPTIKKDAKPIKLPVGSSVVPQQSTGGKVASLASITLPLVNMPPVVSPQTAKEPATSPPPASVPLVESPEKQKQKENILRNLGLLTLKEADEAKQEKQKQKELLIKSNKTTLPKVVPGENYTGTLKTVIKINRNSLDKKKSRSPLKMTFQKSKGRGSKVVSDGMSGDSESDENHYYTIHKEYGGSSACGTGSAENQVTGGHRKTHYSNRFNNHDPSTQDPLGEVVDDAHSPGKETTLNLVIPEKASSFGIHPGRLCQDQCFYCGGKFGLFDTPCHVAQIKSSERQKKILENEEKLTVDSCLCDACYRHVDRRANCPSYRKRAGPGAVAAPPPAPGAAASFCHASGCRRHAPHTLRRKWLVKMRKSIAKVVDLDLDYPGLHTIPLCEVHYQAVSHLMVCGLCRRTLSRNHVHYINQEYQTLNPLLQEQSIPVKFLEKPVVCKLCRYYCTLLLRPNISQPNHVKFLKTYRRRLMLAHNIEIPDDSDTECTDDLMSNDLNKEHNESSKEKKKDKNKNGKNKTKKSADSNRSADENHSSNIVKGLGKEWKNKGHDKASTHNKVNLEEDIESLISSNKIPVPKSGQLDDSQTHYEISDSSDLEAMMDFDMSIGSLDKQSELQFLLQRCNVPSSTILQRGPPANLTQKSRNILKVHNATAISKSTLHQKVVDKNAKRIQKLGQVITRSSDVDASGNRTVHDFTLEMADKLANKDLSGLGILRNIALNDECTIETIPAKNSKGPVDLNSMKNKWLMTDSFSTVKKNLSALSKNKRMHNQADLQSSNPVRRLETNPSISVRELFPGEEEMNLQCSIDFANVKAVTLEGWEKYNSTVQFDVGTKKLWQDLQKPYGNQSSFLRHLILLEKYFRNGDLILSQNANCNAAAYSESLQNRLRSYDNISSSGDSINPHVVLGQPVLPKIPSLSVVPHIASPPPPLPPETILEASKKTESSSLIDFRKQKTSTLPGKSLLKTNQASTADGAKSLKGSLQSYRAFESLPPPSVNQAKIPKNVPISIAQINQSVDISKLPKNMPISLTQLEKMSNQIHLPVTPRPPTPRPEAIKSLSEFAKPPPIALTLAIEAKMAAAKAESLANKTRAPSLPPELIAINPTAINQTANQKKTNVETLLMNMIKNVSTPSQPILASAVQTPGFSPIAIALPSTQTTPNEAPTVVPAEPTKKAKGSSKQWRPTLIPITDESKTRSARDVLYQTADGRRLPSLVQVMSGGKPYHITIQDYNRMCIMRREKLQQIQKTKLSGKSSSSSGTTPSSPAQAETVIDIPVTPTATEQVSGTPTSPTAVPESAPAQTLDPKADPTATTPQAKGPPPKEDSKTSDKPGSTPDLCPITILRNVNVNLKNVTINPITSADGKSSKTGDGKSPRAANSTVTSQSLLLSGPKGSVSLPSIVAQLSSSISVTAESTPTKSLAALSALSAMMPDAVAITSQAIVMPKIPKSLTVIPQAAPLAAPLAPPSPPQP